MRHAVPDSKASTSSRTTRAGRSCATRALCFGAVLVAGHGAVAAAVTRGLNYGVDFKGGSLIEVQSKTGADRHRRDMRTKLDKLGIGDVQIQSFGAGQRGADPRRAAAAAELSEEKAAGGR